MICLLFKPIALKIELMYLEYIKLLNEYKRYMGSACIKEYH